MTGGCLSTGHGCHWGRSILPSLPSTLPGRSRPHLTGFAHTKTVLASPLVPRHNIRKESLQLKIRSSSQNQRFFCLEQGQTRFNLRPGPHSMALPIPIAPSDPSKRRSSRPFQHCSRSAGGPTRPDRLGSRRRRRGSPDLPPAEERSSEGVDRVLTHNDSQVIKEM